MKKCILICLLILSMMLCSCSNYATVLSHNEIDKDKTVNISMFVIVEEASTWRVVYHKDTKVMYAVSHGNNSYGEFTLLVNPDGSPMMFQD